MADAVVQLPEAQAPLGDKLDSEQLVVATETVKRQRVQVTFKGEVAGDVAEGGSVPQPTNALGLAIRRVRDRSSVQTFASGELLDDSPTSFTTTSFDCSPYKSGLLYLDLTIAGTPTSLDVIPEFSDDGGTDWFELTDSSFPLNIASLSTSKRAYPVSVLGRLIRFRFVGNGTTVSDTITITATAEFYD